MLNNEKKTKISTKWDVWKKFTHSKVMLIVLLLH